MLASGGKSAIRQNSSSSRMPKVAWLNSTRRAGKAKLKSREQANEEMHGLGFGFSTFFDADPAGWEGKLKLLSCHPADSDPDQIVATFGFLEKKIATAVRKMIVVADTRRGDLREFMLMFRDKSSILLRFSPDEKKLSDRPLPLHHQS